jgi:large subunit ribosomal protein L27e
VIITASESGTKGRKYPHCLVAGIDRYPRRVHKNMSKARIQSRIKVKPFLKYVNLNHVMPTRYAIASELELAAILKQVENAQSENNNETDILENADFRSTLRKSIKESFEDKYAGLNLNDSSDETNSRLKFFFRRLRF